MYLIFIILTLQNKTSYKMKIYTSYFAMQAKIKELGITPVAISIYPPKWYNGLRFPQLAPTKQIKDLEVEEYIPKFNALLSKLNPHTIVKELTFLGNNKDIALLCYEKPSDFCHRQLVAKWLNENGYEVSELTFGNVEAKPKEVKPKPIQLFMF